MIIPKQEFKVGDIIVNNGVEREITEVRETGYTWRYLDSPKEVDWVSENSSDPFFERDWAKLTH